MTMTIYFDTITGAVMTSRVVLGIVLAVGVILIEAWVLYKLKWVADSTASLVDEAQATTSDRGPGKQFMLCSRDSFLANLASTVIGWFLAQYVLFFDFWSIPFWIAALVITIVVETLVLWALKRKSLARSSVTALAMNAASYAMLILLFGLAYQLELASSI
jgi:hypothetical protein